MDSLFDRLRKLIRRSNGEGSEPNSEEEKEANNDTCTSDSSDQSSSDSSQIQDESHPYESQDNSSVLSLSFTSLHTSIPNSLGPIQSSHNQQVIVIDDSNQEQQFEIIHNDEERKEQSDMESGSQSDSSV